MTGGLWNKKLEKCICREEQSRASSPVCMCNNSGPIIITAAENKISRES